MYELGQAHSIFTAFGGAFGRGGGWAGLPQALWVWVSDALPLDLVASIHWNDPLDTTYTQTVSYTLPAATATGNFTASLISTDQAQVCLFVFVFVYAPVYVCALGACMFLCLCLRSCLSSVAVSMSVSFFSWCIA